MGEQMKRATEAVYGKSVKCLRFGCDILISRPRPGQKFCRDKCKNDHHAYVREQGKKIVNSKGKRFSPWDSSLVQRMFNFLKDGREKTSLEIIKATNDCDHRSTIASLKHHGEDRGFTIPPAKYKGRTGDNRKIYAYRLIWENGE